MENNTMEKIDTPDSTILGNGQIHGQDNLVGRQIPHDLIPGGEKPQGGLDPSLSSYETLLITLLNRVKVGYMTDSISQDAVRRKKLGLVLRNDLHWKGHLLYVPNNCNTGRKVDRTKCERGSNVSQE